MAPANMKSKIEKLLRLAESSNPHEAELATRQAERLMVKWGIDEAELDAKGQTREEVIEFHRTYGPNSRAWVPFAHAVCMGLGNIKTLKMKLNGTRVRFYVIGHKSDVERADMLLDSLEIQAERAMLSWWATYEQKHFIEKSQWYKAKHQFLISFGMEVGRRLKEMRTEEVVERGTGTALVLASREKVVESWMHQNHNVRKSRGRLDGSAHGRVAGQAAGRTASLGEKAVGGGRTALG